jgi:uncharacterized protein
MRYAEISFHCFGMKGRPMIHIRNASPQGIPITIIHDSNFATYQGVFFLIHGHTGNRHDATIVQFQHELAALGFYTVALDAYRHGDRKEEPYVTLNGEAIAKAMPGVLDQTCQDITTLYQSEFQSISAVVGVLGTSMGGHVAYLLPNYLPATLISIPLIGAPDGLRHYRTSKRFLGDAIEALFESLPNLKKPSPELYANRHLLQINGDKDDVVRYENALDFHGELPTHSAVEHWFVLESCGHEITPHMHQVVAEFIQDVTPKLKNS